MGTPLLVPVPKNSMESELFIHFPAFQANVIGLNVKVRNEVQQGIDSAFGLKKLIEDHYFF
jgi:hypothetical protein